MQIVKNVAIDLYREVSRPVERKRQSLSCGLRLYVITQRAHPAALHLSVVVGHAHLHLAVEIEVSHRRRHGMVFGTPHLVDLHRIDGHIVPLPVARLAHLHREIAKRLHPLACRVTALVIIPRIHY